MERKEKIAEGKTKIIWAVPGSEDVLIESKDDITAGDGARRDIVKDKGILATETTCNCFRLLGKAGIQTHFIGQIDERTFQAIHLRMIPIELVARRIATGSYLKRHPRVEEGTIFDQPIVEFFFKDDARHDPLMIWNDRKKCFGLYDAKKPLEDSHIGDLLEELPGVPKSGREVAVLSRLLESTFLRLENAWQDQSVSLVDLKIECGFTPKGELRVGDVIDNDSWRIWPYGDKKRMKDKQIYRDANQVTAEVLANIKESYAWVAAASRRFI